MSNPDVSRLEKELQDQKDKYSILEAQCASERAAKDSLEKRLRSVQGDLTSVQGDLTNVQDHLTRVKESIAIRDKDVEKNFKILKVLLKGHLSMERDLATVSHSFRTTFAEVTNKLRLERDQHVQKLCDDLISARLNVANLRQEVARLKAATIRH